MRSWNKESDCGESDSLFFVPICNIKQNNLTVLLTSAYKCV